jgi:hypothetical protein
MTTAQTGLSPNGHRIGVLDLFVTPDPVRLNVGSSSRTLPLHVDFEPRWA